MKRSRFHFTLVFVLVLLAGCTSNAIRRPQVVPDLERLDAVARNDGCYWSGSVAAEAKDRLTAQEKKASPSVNPYAVNKNGICGQKSVEVTEQYKLFFVEFDEQGRLYDDRQFELLFRYLEDRVHCKNKDLSIVTFVHGWRHNADYDDKNVQLAREVLSFTYLGEQVGNHPNIYRKAEYRRKCREGGVFEENGTAAREVVGIFIGWRGKSLTGFNIPIVDNWELFSVFDRKLTAENVAVGTVRELFSRLRVFQGDVNAGEDNCEEAAQPYQCRRVRLLIVGHSFGGLLVYNAIAASLMDSLSQGAFADPKNPENCTKVHVAPDPKGGMATARNYNQADSLGAETTSRGRPIVRLAESALVESFADLIVLINPAVEGARFEPLHQAVRRRSEGLGFCPNQKPVLVAITAANDIATRYAFQFARLVSTVFESNTPIGIQTEDAVLRQEIRRDEESTASTNALGHVSRFRSHTLRMPGSEAKNNNEFGAAADSYCNADSNRDANSKDPIDALLKMCRCGTLKNKTWESYVGEKLLSQGDKGYSCPAYVEELNAAEMALQGATVPKGWTGPGSGFMLQRNAWRITYCGGPTLSQIAEYNPRLRGSSEKLPDWATTYHKPNSPMWIIRSEDTAIVDNHSGIFEFGLKTFIQQLYHSITLQNYDVAGFEKMGSRARNYLERNCVQ